MSCSVCSSWEPQKCSIAIKITLPYCMVLNTSVIIWLRCQINNFWLGWAMLAMTSNKWVKLLRLNCYLYQKLKLAVGLSTSQLSMPYAQSKILWIFGDHTNIRDNGICWSSSYRVFVYFIKSYLFHVQYRDNRQPWHKSAPSIAKLQICENFKCWVLKKFSISLLQRLGLVSGTKMNVLVSWKCGRSWSRSPRTDTKGLVYSLQLVCVLCRCFRVFCVTTSCLFH